LVPVITIEQTVHKRTIVRLQIERVDWTGAGFVLAIEIEDGDGDYGHDPKRSRIDAKVVIRS
jgi:hypothetical protein